MVTPGDAASRLGKHFAETSSEEFTEHLDKYCPEFSEGNSVEDNDESQESSQGQLILFQPQSTPLRLEAYLACALSGLTTEQRQLMFQLSDTIAIICESLDIDLYEPRKNTDPVHHPHVEDSEVFRTDRARVVNSDLLIHLTHYPSTGSGEELDFAYNALLPIILVSHSDTRVSRMVTGIPAFKIRIDYTEPEDLRRELKDCLLRVRPILEERKLAFSAYRANIVGEKIRLLREEINLTREELANSAHHLTVESLRHIEESVDTESNPSLIQLREIATVLKTTVADLVEPDLGSRLVSTLEDWMTRSGRTAARFDSPSIKDRNRLLRRMLLRMIDSLEDE